MGYQRRVHGTHPIFESDFDCLTDCGMARRQGLRSMDLKQWMYRNRMLKLYQRLLRGIYKVPVQSEKEYYLQWASDEFRALKESNDEYLIKMNQLEAEKWVEQFEKIYKRTTDGMEEK